MTAKRLTDLPSPVAAASGCAVVALFLAGAVVTGERPPIDASGQDLVEFIEAERTRIQIAAGLSAAAAPFFICFQSMAAAPEVAIALLDFEFVAMGAASFSVVAMLVAAAFLVLRHGVVWPRWVGGLAAVTAALYLLRAGTLFTTDGAFAADGVFGLWVPVGALVAWLLAASTVLARDLHRGEVPGVGAG